MGKQMKNARERTVQSSDGLTALPLAQKFSINLSAAVGSQLKRTAFEQRLSESSIVEVALDHLFARISPEVLGAFLRQHGACLRRKA